jgi:hypothetical protein
MAQDINGKMNNYLLNINNNDTLLMENLIAEEKTRILMEFGIKFQTKNKKAMDKYNELDKIQHYEEL